MVQLKKRYLPDLAKEASVCEANYWRLQRLLPDQDRLDYRTLEVHHGDHSAAKINFEVLDRFKYTLTLLIDYRVQNLPKSVNSLRLIVRMYHDVNMAEVVDCEKGSQLDGIYNYPNKTMYHIDEKSQLNLFLAECLSQCLSHGIENELVFKAPSDKP